MCNKYFTYRQTSVELPLHITSVIDAGLPSPPNLATDSPMGCAPPPPPKGYTDTSNHPMESPDFPPLPPLPPDADPEDEERHPLMSPLDVNRLPARAPVLMDNPREVIGASRGNRKDPVYTITSVSGGTSVPPKDPPPSEISV